MTVASTSFTAGRHDIVYRAGIWVAVRRFVLVAVTLGRSW